MMNKNNWEQTIQRFDRFWKGAEALRIVVADVKRPGPVFVDIEDYSDERNYFIQQSDYLKSGSYHGDAIPDIAPYLGPGSLAIFIGAKPFYANGAIWYESGCKDLSGVYGLCEDFISRFDEFGKMAYWYRRSIDIARLLKNNEHRGYVTSIPDLEQNLDILSAIMGPAELLMAINDDAAGVVETLELMYCVWEKAYESHWEIATGKGETECAFTHYNIIGKGRTSILQSDISCMLSPGMFNRFEMPLLRKQAGHLDNIIYHLDGPGAERHLDSILSIEEIAAVQWVPGAGNPGNADSCWNPIYDKIVEAGKGLYVFLMPEEIDGFIQRYGSCRLLIRTIAENALMQKELSEKYCVL